MLQQQTKSIRAFIGAKDFDISRAFYRDLGFEEIVISEALSLLRSSSMGFYLQKYYVEDWVNNTTLFLEVTNVADFWDYLQQLNLPEKYPEVRLGTIKEYDWGRECFIHDPSGVLWHVGEFYP
ncbi:MAG TPA: glyoxalase [Microscillaceae bacterium]|nr:glyoxalase [Microscillaceae bacterium]